MEARISLRRREVDIARGIAICCMVLYHTAYDLEFFFDVSIGVLRGPWWIFARATAILFLLLSGVSSALSQNTPRRVLRRFMRIALAAAVISGVTFVMDSETFVGFGILHLIAVATLLLPLLKKQQALTLLLAMMILILSIFLQDLHSSTSLLLPLGVTPSGFRSIDYFPLLPWLAVPLLGRALGQWWYGDRESPVLPQDRLRWLQWMGRHALLLYLVHQPLILTFLWTLYRM